MPDDELKYLSRAELEAEVLRLRTHHHLARKAASQRAIFDSAVDFAVVATDHDGLITDWNHGAERVMGWSAAEMQGSDASRFFTPEDQAQGRLRVEMETALQDGRAADERWHLRKGGERFWASGEMMPLRDDNGMHLGFVKILRDRTEEHLAGLELREAEHRRQALLALSNALLEENANVLDLALAGCRTLGQTLQVQLVGYGLVDPEAETITVERDWTAGTAQSLAGTLNFRDFGSYIDDLKLGRSVVITDVRTDLRTRSFAAALEARSARAFVNTPVFEQGYFVALLYVSSDQPRKWTQQDLEFIHEVAARTRTATARHQAEKSLRISEAEVRRIADAMPVLVSFIDRDLRYRFVNAAYENWFQIPRHAVMGRSIPELLGETGYAERRAYIDQVLSGHVAHFDLLWPWPDGRRRIADIRYTPHRDQDGDVDGFYVFAQDVTSLRDAAALLAENAASLTAQVAIRTAERNRLWQTTTDLMGTASFEGHMRGVNPAWTRVLGWSEADLLKRPFLDIIDSKDHNALARALQCLRRGESVEAFVDRLHTADGNERTIMWTFTPDSQVDTDIFHVQGRDVTEQLKTEAQLRQSQKMEAVGQLTGGLAHDFNNLLAGVSVSLELMAKRIVERRFEALDKYLIAAQGAAKRAAVLTHRLLAFSRQQALSPTVVSANTLIGEMVELIQRSVGPTVEVRFFGSDDLWQTLVDPSQLENALLNLCINARDAMPGGGRIIIETANSRIDGRSAGHYDMPEGEYVALSVSDTGTGMPQEVIAKAFEPFFTTKPVGQGTGLGLSMIYGFAKQSGGQTRIHSTLGEGTIVSIYLPRHEGTASGERVLVNAIPVMAVGEGETVLIVEDESTVRMLVADVLREVNYAILEAADANAALKVLQSDAQINLVVTDIGLPGSMNGLGLASTARKKRPDLKVLFITGFAEKALFYNDQLPPGTGLLTKPFTVDALVATVGELLRQ